MGSFSIRSSAYTLKPNSHYVQGKEDRRIEKTLKGLKSEMGRPNPDFKMIAQATADISHNTDHVIQTLGRL